MQKNNKQKKTQNSHSLRFDKTAQSLQLRKSVSIFMQGGVSSKTKPPLLFLRLPSREVMLIEERAGGSLSPLMFAVNRGGLAADFLPVGFVIYCNTLHAFTSDPKGEPVLY